MPERIQDIIGRFEEDRIRAYQAGDFRGGRTIRGLQIQIARAVTRGYLHLDADQPVETPEIGRRFSAEQLQGLESIGFTFVVDAKALFLDQLAQDPSIKHLFAYVPDIVALRNIIPVARQVAVNPRQPYIEGSKILTYDEQLEVAGREVKKIISTPVKKGSLEGIDFGPDRASVLSQLDFAYQARFNGQKLYPDYFVRSNDEYDHPRFGPGVTSVGRRDPGSRLGVGGWNRSFRGPGLGLSLVATPSGTR